MPPKSKFNKEDIINAAIDVVRKKGSTALTARSLAEKLGSSSKPIFGFFTGMDELQAEVLNYAGKIYGSYIEKELSLGKYPDYKSTGIAYIKFAKEEKELFKLLFMRDRTGEEIRDGREDLKPILKIIMKNLSINEDEAFMLHLKLWITVHGIASMIATSYLEWNDEFISETLTDAYNGAKFKYINR